MNFFNDLEKQMNEQQLIKNDLNEVSECTNEFVKLQNLEGSQKQIMS